MGMKGDFTIPLTEPVVLDEKRKIILDAANKYGFTPNKFASRLSMKNVRIGILIYSRFTVNTDKMIAGIESAYEKLKDYNYDFEILEYVEYIDDELLKKIEKV